MLGIATGKLHGKPTSTFEGYVDDTSGDPYFGYDYYKRSREGFAITHATKAAITAWPIVFAAILGQTLKAVATYQVERGIRLGVATNIPPLCNMLTDL